MSKRKTGKLNKQEQEYIRNHPELDAKEIAAKLGRTPELIRKFRAQIPSIQHAESLVDAVSRLHTSYFWPAVRQQLLDHEVEYFEQQWVRYWDQFSHSDVLATDEITMKDVIILDIMCNRANIRKTQASHQERVLTEDIANERRKDLEERNEALISELEARRGNLFIIITEATREFREFQKSKDDKLKQLKATRDQRLQRQEQSGRNFFELIRALNDMKARRRDSITMEKMKIAAERVRQDFEQVHKFSDDDYDKPLLTPEGELRAKEKEND
jgi:hypothetical protein